MDWPRKKSKKTPEDLWNKKTENVTYTKPSRNQIDVSKQISYSQKHSEGNLWGLFCLTAYEGGPKADWQTLGFAPIEYTTFAMHF